MFKVVVSDKRHADYSIEEKILKECGADLVVLNCTTEKEMIENCSDADGVLLDMAPMTRDVVKAMSKCKIVSRYGVGFDNVDVQACTEKGICVANVPDYCCDDVSEMALALLFACQRQVCLRDRKIREGLWNLQFQNTFRIKGKVLSLIGFGRISRALAQKASGFELKETLVFDPYVDEEVISRAGGRKVSFEEALAQGDYISLHMPVTNETRGMINEKAFEIMKHTAILINTSRGPLIKDDALISALKNKRIAFAGLDTHNIEPLPADSELLKLENCVLTDHAAYNTREAVEELKRKAALNIKAVLEGNKAPYCINKL
jgi:D-3-phosphoglycerate dehydrogenase